MTRVPPSRLCCLRFVLKDAAAIAICKQLGADPEEPYVALGFVASGAELKLVGDLKIGTPPADPSPMVLAKVARLFKVARVAAGTEVKAPPPASSASGSGDKPWRGQVDFGAVMIQGGNLWIDTMSKEALDNARKRRVEVCSSPPAHAKEPTDAQITCFEFNLNTRNSVD